MVSILNKRIQREILYIKENMPSYSISDEIKNIESIDSINTIDSNVYITIITPNGNKLSFTLSKDYPFKPPKQLKINDTDYIYSIKNMPQKIYYLYYDPQEVYFQEKLKSIYYTKPKCLCCSSLLCSDNWSPVSTIYYILNEINSHNNIKRNIKYKLMLKEIFNYFNLPLDIIGPIYEYL